MLGAGEQSQPPLSWMRRIVAAIMSMSRIAHLACVEVTRATHPRLRADASDPVSERWNPAEVFKNMLLADQTDRHMAARCC